MEEGEKMLHENGRDTKDDDDDDDDDDDGRSAPSAEDQVLEKYFVVRQGQFWWVSSLAYYSPERKKMGSIRSGFWKQIF